jgi:hypothetical protein
MPYTGIVLAILAFHAAAFLILLGHWVAAAGMFPQATRAFAAEYDRRPIRATLIGLFTYGPLILLLLSAGKIPNPLIRLVILVAGLAALLIALIGSAGLAWRIGRNLSSNGDAWSQALRGGVMLALVFITPLLGSLFLLHVGLASGFGVVLLARPWKAKVTPVPQPLTAPDGLPAEPAPALS